MKNNQNGITLVALVITIIVLLILAGVSIAALGGQNGILTKATDAKSLDEIGAAKDQVALAANEGIQDYYETVYVTTTNGTASTVTAQDKVFAKIQALGTPIGKAVASYNSTDKTVTLTSSDGKKTVTGTVHAATESEFNGGELTWSE